MKAIAGMANTPITMITSIFSIFFIISPLYSPVINLIPDLPSGLSGDMEIMAGMTPGIKNVN
jgi:hypothetical protein